MTVLYDVVRVFWNVWFPADFSPVFTALVEYLSVMTVVLMIFGVVFGLLRLLGIKNKVSFAVTLIVLVTISIVYGGVFISAGG